MHKAYDTLIRDGFKAQGRKGKGKARQNCMFSVTYTKIKCSQKMM
jgi:hypothetical protein